MNYLAPYVTGPKRSMEDLVWSTDSTDSTLYVRQSAVCTICTICTLLCIYYLVCGLLYSLRYSLKSKVSKDLGASRERWQKQGKGRGGNGKGKGKAG